jgi:hypothetical protein
MRTLKERGVTFIMGSDLHNAENPVTSPFHLTWVLGVPPEGVGLESKIMPTRHLYVASGLILAAVVIYNRLIPNKGHVKKH